MTKGRILILLDNPFENDRRVYRQAASLAKANYNVILIAVKKESLPEQEAMAGFDVHRIFNPDIFDIKQSSCFASYAGKILDAFSFDIIHAHDQVMLHLAVQIKKRKTETVLVYDSHELFHAWPLNVSNYDSNWLMLKSWLVRKWQILREKRNAKHIDYLITVNQSLADDLKQHFKIQNEISVVRNVPEKASVKEKTQILRQKFNIPAHKRILVFIGANIYRHTLNLEQVMSEMQSDEYTALVFICAFNHNSQPVMDYVAEKNFKNIHFHDLIKPTDIPFYLASADVGLVPTWNKKDLSYWYALDNKLFEYIQSGIPVLATKQPEYKNIVEAHQCGICANPDREGDYVKSLHEIYQNYDFFKKNTAKAAVQLVWEKEESILINFYKKLIDG